MPRKVRDAALETRTARSRLKVRHKPYFRLIEPGLHLGYRKLASGPGTWVARRYDGDGGYTTENLRTIDAALVLADDYEDADGRQILSFAQAQQKVRGTRKTKSGPFSVSDVLDNYLRFLEGEGRSRHSLASTRYRIEAFIRPQLGKISAGALTAERLRRWRDEIARAPARLRTGKGNEQNFRDDNNDADKIRGRRASANRTWAILRAALNHAFRDDRVESDAAWRKVKPFENVDSARIRYLTVAEAKRLINACNLEFRPLVQAAVQTGARYGELTRLQVRDFNADAGTVAVRQSKSGKPRHIILTDEGAALFKQLCAGKTGDALILHRDSGEAWGRSVQWWPMNAAVKAAGIKPAISFHGLRHTWASLAVMAGMPLMVVARNLGHVDTHMVEKHYGHLSASYVAETVRKHAPSFGFKPDKKVVELRGGR
jgi:integrase